MKKGIITFILLVLNFVLCGTAACAGNEEEEEGGEYCKSCHAWIENGNPNHKKTKNDCYKISQGRGSEIRVVTGNWILTRAKEDSYYYFVTDTGEHQNKVARELFDSIEYTTTFDEFCIDLQNRAEKIIRMRGPNYVTFK